MGQDQISSNALLKMIYRFVWQVCYSNRRKLLCKEVLYHPLLIVFFCFVLGCQICPSWKLTQFSSSTTINAASDKACQIWKHQEKLFQSHSLKHRADELESGEEESMRGLFLVKRSSGITFPSYSL